VSKEDGVIRGVDEKALVNGVIDTLIDSTKGWFSTPLTREWLETRVKFDIPTDAFSEPDFEGSVEYQADSLVISKEVFLFQCVAINVRKAEKVVISFEDVSEDVEDADLPLTTDDVIGIGPTRRTIQKDVVMNARNKAARALFAAESLTHAFLEEYGETDWEDSD